jgi:predicted phosphodiesterase
MKGLERPQLLIPFLLSFLIFCSGCSSSFLHTKNQNGYDYAFIFMTDMHIQPEKSGVEGFRQAIKKANELNPAFVITGGDLIMDALGQSYERANLLYNLYSDSIKEINVPVYNTLGNHELFGLYNHSEVDPAHPEYGKKMYQQRIGQRFYSFDHRGWHFMILDSVSETEDRHYKGLVDPEQMEWIKKDLLKVNKNTPVVISVHIPLITAINQFQPLPLAVKESTTLTDNAREVLDLFEEHNLKLVLQGHLHFLEDIYIGGIHFITGGAVCGRWWEGPNNGLEEGFIVVYITGREFTWKYVDYGWNADSKID